jgi:predicted nuclease of restriction endonuclease-like (RecB) superfamily
MKQFYETYAENEKLATVLREIGWSQNLTIFSHCKTDGERAFYLHLTVKNIDFPIGNWIGRSAVGF